MKDKIAFWYRCHIWTEEMVRNAVIKNVLTQSEADEILGV